jgi:hypothetical protein
MKRTGIVFSMAAMAMTASGVVAAEETIDHGNGWSTTCPNSCVVGSDGSIEDSEGAPIRIHWVGREDEK